MPWAHFSSLPSTPQAVRTTNNGIVKPLKPGMDPAISWRNPVKPLAVAPGGNVGTFESHPVSKVPMRPIAVLLPLSRLPIVSPSAIDLAQRQRFAAWIDEATDEIKDFL